MTWLDSLTGPGKAALAVLVIGVFALGILFSSQCKSSETSSSHQAILLPTVRSIATAPIFLPTSTLGASPSPEATLSSLSPTPAQQPSPVTTTTPISTSAPSATAPPDRPAPSATLPAPPTEPPLPPATATAALPSSAGCSVSASVSDPNPPVGAMVTLAAALTCNGLGTAGSQMTAVFHFTPTTSTCRGVADGTGRASCSVRVASAGAATVDACFLYQAQLACGQTSLSAR